MFERSITIPRSNRAEVRNPILALPSFRALQLLDVETRLLLRALLLDIQRDARERADKSWRAHKPPIAAYWAAIGVFAGHIARAIMSGRGASEGARP